MKNSISRFYFAHFNHIIDLIPNLLWPIKLFVIKKSLGRVGIGSKLSHKSIIANPKKVLLSNNVFIGPNFYCSSVKGVIFSDRVMLGPNIAIIGGDHRYDCTYKNMRMNKEQGDNRIIKIESDAWIGHGSTLLKNAHVGEGTIIGANSLVNSTTIPYSVYAGQPAKFIKPRFKTYDLLNEYLLMMKKEYHFNSKYSEEYLRSIYDS